MSRCKPRVRVKAITQKFDAHKNERGFTLIELLVASVLSILMIALVSRIFQSQEGSFVLQDQLNGMQTNGRAAVDFFSRAVQNAGYNVFRGTRFLAASDHYITAVYDQDNDGVIQNDEVMTFAVGNAFSAVDETFNIDPFFDMDQDGYVSAAETAQYPITMTLTGPPYNLYKVTPNNSGSGFTRDTVARNIDNLIIRYYDRNNNLLPAGIDVNNDGIPDIGTYSVPLAELNDVRKIDIEMIVRTRDGDLRKTFINSGTYAPGSVAVRGGASYSDGFHRQTFSANSSPKNLVMAPWGRMDITANPDSVSCPGVSTAITASMVDSLGDPVGVGFDIDFTASGGSAITLAPVSGTTNSLGEVAATISYDWTSPHYTTTLSASGLVAVGGTEYPVFSAIPVAFQSGAAGAFSDTFNGGLDPDWVELDDPADMFFDSDTYKMSATGLTRAVNGCDWRKYQVEFELTASGDLPGGGFAGGYVRHEDSNNNYRALIYRKDGSACLGLVEDYCLRLIKWDGAITELAAIGVDFAPATKYKILAQAEGTNLRAKIWNADALGAADPNPGVWIYDGGGFPAVYPVTAVDTSYASGKIGLLGDFNGIDVVFDNFVVSVVS